MKTHLIVGFAAFGLLAGAASAQQAAPAAPPQSGEVWRALAASPVLPMERVVKKLNAPRKIAVAAMSADKAGNLYIHSRPKDKDDTADTIMVFDAEGRYLRSFGPGLTLVHALKVDPAGNVWTVDVGNSMVYKFTPEGKKLLELDVGGIPDPTKRSCGASTIDFAPGGNFYIADGYCNSRIIEYAADGKKVREFGKAGKAPGEIGLPHDVGVGKDGNLYVGDRPNGRLSWYDKSGKFLGEKNFDSLVFTSQVDADGMVYVSAAPFGTKDWNKDSITYKFDPKSGKVLGKLDQSFAHEMTIQANGTIYMDPGGIPVKVDSDPEGIYILYFKPKK